MGDGKPGHATPHYGKVKNGIKAAIASALSLCRDEDVSHGLGKRGLRGVFLLPSSAVRHARGWELCVNLLLLAK